MARATYNSAPLPDSQYGIEMQEEAIAVNYYGPYSNYDPTGPRGHRNNTVQFAHGQGVHSGSIGPVNAPGGPHSDDLDVWRLPCVLHDAGCALAPAYNETENATPALFVGARFYQMEVSTDPSSLPSRQEEVQPMEEPRTRAFFPPLPGDEEEHSERRGGPQPDDSSDALLQIPSFEGPNKEGLVPPGVKPFGQGPAKAPPGAPLALLVAAASIGVVAFALALGLYSRFHGQKDVLQSKTRDRLVSLVREDPGITVTDAAKALGMGRNALLHHVTMLEKVQVVRIETAGGRRTLYLVGAKREGVVPAWLLKNPACLALVQAIQARPEGISRQEAHALLPDVPLRTRNYNIGKLLSVGVIEEILTPSGVKTLRAKSVPGARDANA